MGPEQDVPQDHPDFPRDQMIGKRQFGRNRGCVRQLALTQNAHSFDERGELRNGGLVNITTNPFFLTNFLQICCLLLFTKLSMQYIYVIS